MVNRKLESFKITFIYDFCFQAQRKWEADEEEHKRKKRDYEIRMIEMEEVNQFPNFCCQLGFHDAVVIR